MKLTNLAVINDEKYLAELMFDIFKHKKLRQCRLMMP